MIKVFLDTNVLLTGFAAFRRGQPLPACLVDPAAKRYTFEKCIFEAYMAFRGIGGKKPDEGRGDWAERYLRDKADPSSVGKLISQVHAGDKEYAYFWINQILEAEGRLDHLEEMIDQVVRLEEREKAYAHVMLLRQLALEREKFEGLCDEFSAFLDKHSVETLPYGIVFDLKRDRYITSDLTTSMNAAILDSFVRDTVLPSEDFEIIFAALSLPADLFVTDDARLITCAMSLGVNFLLSPNSFCTREQYSARVQQLLDQIRANEASDSSS